MLAKIWFESRKETHMTNAFKSIKQGLTEAIAHAKTKDTETTGAKPYQPYAVNVSTSESD